MRVLSLNPSDKRIAAVLVKENLYLIKYIDEYDEEKYMVTNKDFTNSSSIIWDNVLIDTEGPLSELIMELKMLRILEQDFK